MTVNVALLRQVVEHIEANPEEHSQNTWRDADTCGTTMCVAGRTVTLAGEKWATDDPDSDQFQKLASGVHVPVRAAELLGLTKTEADLLFFCEDDEIRDVANHLARGEL